MVSYLCVYGNNGRPPPPPHTLPCRLWLGISQLVVAVACLRRDSCGMQPQGSHLSLPQVLHAGRTKDKEHRRPYRRAVVLLFLVSESAHPHYVPCPLPSPGGTIIAWDSSDP